MEDNKITAMSEYSSFTGKKYEVYGQFTNIAHGRLYLTSAEKATALYTLYRIGKALHEASKDLDGEAADTAIIQYAESIVGNV